MTKPFLEAQLKSVSTRIFTGFTPLPKRQSGHEVSDVGIGKAVGIRALTPLGHIDYTELELVRLPSNRQIDDHTLRSGDVLVTARGSLQKAAIITHDLPNYSVFGSSNIAIIRPKAGQLDSEYLWSWFQNLFRGENSQSLRRASTGQLSMTISDIQRLSIPLPPLDTQHRIGAASGALRRLMRLQAETAAQTETVFDAFLADHFEGDTP